MSQTMNEAVYQIGTVSDMTGIPRNTLLAWERRYGLLDPQRNESGYRLYTEAEVRVLEQVKEYLDRGHRISEAVRLLRRTTVAAPESIPEDGERALEAVRDTLKAHLLDLDRAGAEGVRQRLVLFSFRQAIDGVYLPLLREVGEMWHEGHVSIAQEHFVSAFCREQLIAMMHSLGAGPEGGLRVVCAGYPGEPHELGLLAVSVKLALRGCRVGYLGSDLPADELARAARHQDADLVCQSVVQPREAAELVAHARALRESLPEHVRVVLGGPGVEGVEADLEGVWFTQDIDVLLDGLEA